MACESDSRVERRGKVDGIERWTGPMCADQCRYLAVFISDDGDGDADDSTKNK